MPTVSATPWLSEDIGVEMERGASKRLSFAYHVIGPWIQGGVNRLAEAINASGIPAWGAAPNPGSQLRVVNKNARFVQNDIDQVIVTVEYQAVGDTGGTRLNEFVFTYAGGVNQIPVQRDAFGNFTTVGYQYPSDDPDFPDVFEVQVADLVRQQPFFTIYATGLLAREYPLQTIEQWIGRVNAFGWGGVPPGWAMMTSIVPRPHNLAAAVPVYQFEFEIQVNPLGWSEDAIFRDPRTGRPPANVVPGVGVVTYALNPSRDFNELFPSVLFAAPPEE
jgi:hypothetical protein